MNWNPIETATKDRSRIRLWNESFHGDGYYCNGGDDHDHEPRWEWCGSANPIIPEPTHWLPNPVPPINTKE